MGANDAYSTESAGGLADRASESDRDALVRLGLSGSASPEEIETLHRSVIEYLAGAPRDLRSWARRQAADADAAYATLLDPAAGTDSHALVEPDPAAAEPGGPAAPPTRRASTPAATPRATGALDEGDDEDALDAAVSPDLHRDVTGTGGRSTRARPDRRASGRPLGRGLRRGIVVVLIAVGAIGIAVAGYNAGAPATAASDGTDDASATPEAGLDRATVAALMAKIQDDPKDTEALFGLADEYFAANDFATAESWLTKLLAIDPRNARALVALGAARFNRGDVEAAEAKWTAALEVDPNNVEAHYDLGFLFYSAEPQDLPGVQREWGKVIELAPGTDLASTVQAHLDSLAGAATSGAPSASSSVPSPATSASPGTTSASPAATSASPAAGATP